MGAVLCASPLVAQEAQLEEIVTTGSFVSADRNAPEIVQAIVDYMEYSETNEQLVAELEAYFISWLGNGRRAVEFATANNSAVLARQRFASTLTFVLAHVILVLGLAAAAFEFQRARRQASTVPENIELRLEMSGVAVKTSLIGLFLFVGAVGFYFLYLKFVYPIQVV